MKKLLILFLLTLLPLMASAEVERTIHVVKAGTLSSYISDEEKYQIEKLTLTGEINGDDIGFLREMAGGLRWSNDSETQYLWGNDIGSLSDLDLSDAKIVAGGLYLSIFWDGSEQYDLYTLDRNDEIPGNAFCYCNSLTSITIPNSVTSIRGNAFYNCKVLSSITIPNSVTSIGSYAFSGCGDLTSITIPNSVTSIGGGAFLDTPWYDNQPDGIVYAGKVLYAYKGTMPEGTSLSIEEGTLGIAGSAFNKFSSLTSIDIPNSVTSIGEGAFSGCSNLTSITIPNSVTSIGSSAFSGCSGLTSITIPNSVTSIGNSAFYNCSSLTSIIIPNSVASIGGRAFKGTSWYDNQPDGIVYAGKVLYAYKGTMPEGTGLSIEEGTLGIADEAFMNYSGLTSIDIPNSVTSIGNSAFYGCSGLTSITIPNSVTSISSSAFSGCSGLTSITIPNSATSIGGGAFYNCSSLTSITIPNSVTYIGGSAFQGCSNLTSIIIPNRVTSISSYAFSGCSGLTFITIPNSVTSIGSYAFIRCSGLTSITIPNSVTTIGGFAFNSCSSLTSITIPNSVTSIWEYAFGFCPLTSIVSGIQNPFPINKVFYCSGEDIHVVATLTVPAGTKEKYQSTRGWKDFVNIVEIEEEEETNEDEIKITSAGQTTWCSKYDLDFTNVEGLKAYIASGYDRETGTIWLTRVKKVPAGEGILLIGDAGDYKVPQVTTTAYYANLMVGTVEAITINETDGEYTNYYLSNGASGIGFYKVNGSVEIKANRAYLPLLKNTVSGTRGFIGMEFGEDADGTTDVQSSMFNLQYPDVYYNLQGQRVDHPSKGLYIKNGKKVLIK